MSERKCVFLGGVSQGKSTLKNGWFMISPKPESLWQPSLSAGFLLRKPFSMEAAFTESDRGILMVFSRITLGTSIVDIGPVNRILLSPGTSSLLCSDQGCLWRQQCQKEIYQPTSRIEAHQGPTNPQRSCWKNSYFQSPSDYLNL